MSTAIPIYPFDPNGDAVTNLVPEQQPLKSSGVFDNFYIIPKAAPFFAGSVKLTLYPGAIELKEGKDYTFGHHFMAASHTIGQPIYGSISFYDRSLEGVVQMKYQTLGGDWTLDEGTIIAILANEARNPRITSWESITDLPFQFPVINHKFDIEDFVGMKEVTDQLEDIEAAIRAKGGGAIGDHVNDKNNPHGVTKGQVGLSLVDNYPTATVAEAQAGVLNNRFMTPLRTRQLIETISTAALNDHIANKNNPHETTKGHVGLGLVQNLSLASQAEAEAAASNARYMTPLRVREAIEALVGNQLTAHIADKNNPHGTNKGHVGLGNVPNYPIATTAQAQAATANDLFMTPALTRAAIAMLVGEPFSTHRDDLNNPHQTSKGHVGLGNVQNYGVASEAEARDATLDTKFMTPLRVRQAIDALVGDLSNTHAGDLNNPHKTSKLQVGLGNVDNFATASQADATTGTANDKFMTPLRVAQAIAVMASGSIGPHLTDFDNPHHTTASQVGAYSIDQTNTKLLEKLDTTGVAADSSRVYGMNQPQLEAYIATLKVADSAKLEGKTLAQVKTETLAGKAADSFKLNGKTYDEISAEIGAAVKANGIQFTIPNLGMVKNASSINVVPPGNWMKFGKVARSTTGNNFNDVTLFITGGRDDESLDDDIQASGILSISMTAESPELSPEIVMSVKRAEMRAINEAPTPFTIAYRPMGADATAELELWIYSNKTRCPVYITEMSAGSFTPAVMTTPTKVTDLITVRPAGLVDVPAIASADGQAAEILEAITETLDELIVLFQ